MSVTWGSVSGWWAPGCLILGLLYAWLMYRQPITLAKGARSLLFAFRAFVVALLALLLVSPLIKTVNYQPQKPVVLIAQDNSESIKLFPDKKDPLKQDWTTALQKQLGNNYEVHLFNFDGQLHDGTARSYQGKQTNIANALNQLNERFVNRNIGALVLATDGLYNLGTDPAYEARNIKTTIYTVAQGDTVPRRDLLIGNISYNKTAFLGNDFEVELLAEAYQSQGKIMKLSVMEDGRQVLSQNISVNTPLFKKVIPLKLNADKKGIRKFTFRLAPVANELSVQNNTETIYVEVLDARQKVLLLYDNAHPDISVIKNAIETNRNFEVKTSLVADLGTIKTADCTLAILYQPSAAGYSGIKAIVDSKIPLWFIAGAQADMQGFIANQKVVKATIGRPETQEVFAQPVNGFSAFTLSDSAQNKLGKLPPLLVPFGSYSSANPANVLLKQRIGNVTTAYPLLAFDDEGGRRVAVLAGEGVWRWQLAEYREFGNHHAVDELFSQSVQYLTANANRQRFRVYPSKNVFDEGENILLNAELYNDALELINTPDVNIDLKSLSGKSYSFLFSRNGQSYQLNAGVLPVGEYTYQAVAKNGKQQFKANGQLTVKPLNLETRQSTANHQLLRDMAEQSGGKMLQHSQVGQLAGLIRKNENIKTVVYEDKKYSDLIDFKWIFLLIILLLSAEWFTRKREGEV